MNIMRVSICVGVRMRVCEIDSLLKHECLSVSLS